MNRGDAERLSQSAEMAHLIITHQLTEVWWRLNVSTVDLYIFKDIKSIILETMSVGASPSSTHRTTSTNVHRDRKTM